MNQIPERQNDAKMVRLLRARRALYRNAKRWQGTAVLFALVLPALSWMSSTLEPRLVPTVATLALVYGLLETFFFDPWYKRRLVIGAKLQEEFDWHVLGMDWNEFVAGSREDPELIHRYSKNQLDAATEAQLRDWYPVSVKKLPEHVARVLCQRENVLYDLEMRSSYQRLVFVFLGFLAFVTGAYALAANPGFNELAVAVLAPVTPIFHWAARESRRQGERVSFLERLKVEVDKLWKQANEGADLEQMSILSRRLQDALFIHRAESPLIFDFLYARRRDELEDQMNAGAKLRADEFRG